MTDLPEMRSRGKKATYYVYEYFYQGHKYRAIGNFIYKEYRSLESNGMNVPIKISKNNPTEILDKRRDIVTYLLFTAIGVLPMAIIIFLSIKGFMTMIQ